MNVKIDYGNCIDNFLQCIVCTLRAGVPVLERFSYPVSELHVNTKNGTGKLCTDIHYKVESPTSSTESMSFASLKEIIDDTPDHRPFSAEEVTVKYYYLGRVKETVEMENVLIGYVVEKYITNAEASGMKDLDTVPSFISELGR